MVVGQVSAGGWWRRGKGRIHAGCWLMHWFPLPPGGKKCVYSADRATASAVGHAVCKTRARGE